MKKKLLLCVLTLAMILLLAGCGCDHEWYAANCTTPKTCSLCGETQGEALGHTWKDADCLNPKVCTVCKATEGEALGHTWKDADCLNAKVCSVCSLTEGEALGHDWLEATTEAPKTCSRCQLTEGERLITDPRFTTASTKELHGVWKGEVVMTREMMGLEQGFDNGVDCFFVVTLSNTGEMLIKVELADAEAFMKEMQAFTVQKLYDTLAAEQGLSKIEVDNTFRKEYGMTVEAYVEAQLKNYDFSAVFDMFKLEGCYYVEGDQFFAGEDWETEFKHNKFTLEDGVLTITDFFTQENGEPIALTKVQ